MAEEKEIISSETVDKEKLDDQNQKVIDSFSKIIEVNPNKGAYIGRAKTYINKGDHDAGRLDLDRAIELDPKCAESYYWRAVIAPLNKLSGTLEDYNRAIELSPDNPTYYYSRGAYFLINRNYKEAERDLSKAIQLKPDRGLAYYSRGITHSYLYNFNQTIIDLKKMIKLDPVNANKLLNVKATDYFKKGLYHLCSNKFLEANEYFSNCIVDKNRVFESYFFRALSQYNMSEFLKALRDYDEALKIEPNHAEIYAARAEANFKFKKYEKAIADYAKAIELDPKSPTLYYQNGLKLKTLKKYNDAITSFNKAIELDAQYARAYHRLGEIYSEQNETSSAMICLNQALVYYGMDIDKDPSIPELYYFRSQVYKLLNNPKCAEKDLRRSQKLGVLSSTLDLLTSMASQPLPETKKASLPALSDSNLQRHYETGMSFLRSKELRKAINSFNKTLSLMSTVSNSELTYKIHIAVGSAHLDLNELKEALTALTRAKELKPDFAEAHFEFGRYYELTRQNDKAIESYTEVIKLNKGLLEEAYLARGKLHKKMEVFTAAIEDFQNASKINNSLYTSMLLEEVKKKVKIDDSTSIQSASFEADKKKKKKKKKRKQGNPNPDQNGNECESSYELFNKKLNIEPTSQVESSQLEIVPENVGSEKGEYPFCPEMIQNQTSGLDYNQIDEKLSSNNNSKVESTPEEIFGKYGFKIGFLEDLGIVIEKNLSIEELAAINFIIIGEEKYEAHAVGGFVENTLLKRVSINSDIDLITNNPVSLHIFEDRLAEFEKKYPSFSCEYEYLYVVAEQKVLRLTVNGKQIDIFSINFNGDSFEAIAETLGMDKLSRDLTRAGGVYIDMKRLKLIYDPNCKEDIERRRLKTMHPDTELILKHENPLCILRVLGRSIRDFRETGKTDLNKNAGIGKVIIKIADEVDTIFAKESLSFKSIYEGVCKLLKCDSLKFVFEFLQEYNLIDKLTLPVQRRRLQTPTSKNKPNLSEVAQCDKMEELMNLVQNVQDVNQQLRDPEGNTLLHLIVKNKPLNVEGITCLILYGAKVDIRNNEGKSVMDLLEHDDVVDWAPQVSLS